VQDLYYCGDERPNCYTGAPLKDALVQLEKRQLLLEKCMPYQQPSVMDSEGQDVLCAKSCADTSLLATSGSFTYVRIAQLWEAQRHIRRFGAVVSRRERVLVNVWWSACTHAGT
jgi:hypothetical protein